MSGLKKISRAPHTHTYSEQIHSATCTLIQQTHGNQAAALTGLPTVAFYINALWAEVKGETVKLPCQEVKIDKFVSLDFKAAAEFASLITGGRVDFRDGGLGWKTLWCLLIFSCVSQVTSRLQSQGT